MVKTHRSTVRPIPRDVTESLLALAILEGRMRQARKAVLRLRKQIAARMPSALPLSKNSESLASALSRHNKQSEGGASMTTPSAWPVTARIPQTLHKAERNGWKRVGGDVLSTSADSDAGVVYLEKTVVGKRLRLSIPCRTVRIWGSPSNPEVCSKGVRR